MFHWDQWLIEGKGSHLFYQKFKLNGNKFELIDTPRDLTLGMELDTPPLFTSNENYDLSPDGNLVAFSVHERNHEESWSTSWHTYFIEPSMMDKPFMITKHTEARTQNPKFSLDNTRIAYLAMKTPMLESENLHFEIYNILTGKVSIIDDLLDLSVTDYFWENDHLLYFSSTVLGLNKIFTVDITDTTKPVFKLIDTKSTTASFGLPIKALKNRNIKLSRKVGYNCPERIVTFPKDELIVDTNADNTLLDIIKRLNTLVIVITKSNNLLTKQDIERYNKQYHNLKVVYNNTFHDRYFIIDKSIIYHCGASINRIGYKTFSINLISDEEVCNLLISKVNKII
jgi:hypothetical protein